MSTTITELAQAIPATLTLRSGSGDAPKPEEGNRDSYRYTHLLPHFSQDRYAPLIPYDHVDPGFRALSHPNPRSFLDSATSVVQLTPNLGNEVQGINLAGLDSDGRDQLALEVIIYSVVLSAVLIHYAPFRVGC